MLIWILKTTFSKLVGNVPPEKKKLVWEKFQELLTALAEAGVKGAVEGAKSGNTKF
jgi:hypothetical protein